jgi:hypothetical protein
LKNILIVIINVLIIDNSCITINISLTKYYINVCELISIYKARILLSKHKGISIAKTVH